jgi:hypothetical protein
MGGFAGAQAHLRSFAFGNSHKGKQESRKLGKNNPVAAVYDRRMFFGAFGSLS